MEELVRWTNKTISENSLHPLLIIGVFVVVFLAIHPFQDGNGRLSRILTTLLLLRAGYVYVPYASLESIIEENTLLLQSAAPHAKHIARCNGRLGALSRLFSAQSKKTNH